MLPTIEIKAGESFAAGGSLSDETGAPIDLTGYSGRCEVRTTDGTLVGEVAVTIDAGAAGSFELRAAAESTAAWAIGSHVADVRLVSPGGEVHPSPTFGVRVTRAITLPEETP